MISNARNTRQAELVEAYMAGELTRAELSRLWVQERDRLDFEVFSRDPLAWAARHFSR